VVLVAAVTAAAKLVTPMVVPTVVATVLMHQKTAIAMAATALATIPRGATMLCPIPHSLSQSAFSFRLQAGLKRGFAPLSNAFSNETIQAPSWGNKIQGVRKWGNK
jgi:hypothetical protein